MQLFAADPPPIPGSGGYAPGDTLDPGCAPGSSADCVVNLGTTFTIDANNNMFAGIGAGATLTSGLENYFVGIGAGGSTTTGSDNTVHGFYALFSNTTGNNNIANGLNTLYTNTTGSDNVAIGNYALYSNTIGNNNTALGGSALNSNKTGSGATAIGYNAMLYSNDTLIPFTNSNVAVGYEALRGSIVAANNTGNDNTAIGYQTLTSNTTGYHNTAIGYQTLYSNTTGSSNTAIGFKTLYSNIGGSSNTAFGFFSLFLNTTGYNNVAIGSQALYSNTTGYQNVAVGQRALYTNTIGSYNTIIGYNADVTLNNLSNATAIGYDAKVGADNSLVLGGTGAVAVKVGIGTSIPTNIFHVTGAPTAGTPVARIENTLGGATQNNGLVILAGNDTGVAASEMITFRRPDDTIIGSISQDAATTVAYNLTSDRRIKENISDTDFGLEDLMNIGVVDFNFISDPSQKKMTGFIAQELYKIYPGAVTPNGDDGETNLAIGKTPWMVDYSKLSPLIVKSIQELDLKVEDLIIEKQNLFSNLISWFGDAANGIEKLFVKEVNTERMCIKKSDGTEICITGDELEQILSTSGTFGSLDPVPTPTQVPTPDPVQTSETDLGSNPTEEPTPNPEPASEIPTISQTGPVSEI